MKAYLLSQKKKRQYLLFIFDIFVLAIAIFVSYAIRVYINQKNPSFEEILSKFNRWQILVIIVHLFTLYILDQYNLNSLISNVRSSIMVVLSVWLGGLIIGGVFFFLPKYVFGRQVLLIHLLVVSIFMVLWRLTFIKIGVGKTKSQSVIVVGGEKPVRDFVGEIQRLPNSGFRITGVWTQGTNLGTITHTMDEMKKYENLEEVFADEFDILAFDSTNGVFSDEESCRLLELKYRGKAVYGLSSLYKALTGKVSLDYIDGRWLLDQERLQGGVSQFYLKGKRLIDLFISGFTLFLTTPFLVLIPVAVKLDSRGTVFFVQERLGIRKDSFKCFKFRTMVQNAEKMTGPVWSSKEDPRITRVGKFLRKSRLDELPQLWNVLKGDMSLVGPRPIRAHFAEKLEREISFYDLRFNVKPGLSGWAQVNHDYAGSEEGQLEKFQYELFYIQNMSFFLDLMVIVKTLQKVFKREGV